MNGFFSSGHASLHEQAGLFYMLSIQFQTRIGLLKLDANTKSKEWNLFVPHLDSNKQIFFFFILFYSFMYLLFIFWLIDYVRIYIFIYLFIYLLFI